MSFRIYTEINGGVTGARSAYMKGDDGELRFETRDEAKTYVVLARANRSPYSTFSQRYEIEEV